jgi:hypothetical protein
MPRLFRSAAGREKVFVLKPGLPNPAAPVKAAAQRGFGFRQKYKSM